MNTKRLITLALGSLALVIPAGLSAQDNSGQQSVADAARKAQAQRKDAPRAKLSIDNDNLNTLTGVVNVVGEQPASPPEDQAQKTAAAKPGEKPAEKGEAYWRDKFAAAQKKLDDDSHELDVTQREFNLKQQQFYTDPMASLKQEYSRQDINDTRAKIDDLTAKVDQDKAAISDLQDQLRQAGGDPGWATPPSQPAPSSENSQASSPEQAPAPTPAEPQASAPASASPQQ